MTELKRYLMSPTYKKSSLEEETWCNTLSNGKSVSIVVFNVYRWSNFYVDITEEEKEELLNLDNICLNDYEYELIDMTDGGCDFWIEIQNKTSFSDDEIEEINTLIDEDNEEDLFFSDRMEKNGWVEADCEYTITCKCSLELVENE
jgi:hypothetical protein